MAANSPIGRGRRSRLYIIIGTSLALLAFLAAAFLASAPYLFPAAASGIKIVVAKSSITARTRIDASQLELAVVSPEPPQAFKSIAQVAGKGARVDIPQGLAVTANLIADSPDILSSSDVTYLPIPSGYVAVTIPTSEQVGVGGYVQVGDRSCWNELVWALATNTGQIAIKGAAADAWLLGSIDWPGTCTDQVNGTSTIAGTIACGTLSISAAAGAGTAVGGDAGISTAQVEARLVE